MKDEFIFRLLSSTFCLSIGGMFLWHYPHGHPHWALPSKLGLSGARTFLKPEPCGAHETQGARNKPATTYTCSFHTSVYREWIARPLATG